MTHPPQDDTPSSPQAERRPVVGMLAAFVVVVAIIVVGAQVLFHRHSSTGPISTAGTAATETAAPADHAGH
jgi:hypothetical protein